MPPCHGRETAKTSEVAYATPVEVSLLDGVADLASALVGHRERRVKELAAAVLVLLGHFQEDDDEPGTANTYTLDELMRKTGRWYGTGY